MELAEQTVPGQPLRHSEREGRAPNAATGEAERRELLFVNLAVDRGEPDVVDLLQLDEGVLEDEAVALDHRPLQPVQSLGAELHSAELTGPEVEAAVVEDGVEAFRQRLPELRGAVEGVGLMQLRHEGAELMPAQPLGATIDAVDESARQPPGLENLVGGERPIRREVRLVAGDLLVLSLEYLAERQAAVSHSHIRWTG